MWQFVEVEERGRELSVADLLTKCEELGQDPVDVFVDLGVRSSGGVGGDVVFELKYNDGQPEPEVHIAPRRPYRSEIAWIRPTEEEIEEMDADPTKGWD